MCTVVIDIHCSLLSSLFLVAISTDQSYRHYPSTLRIAINCCHSSPASNASISRRHFLSQFLIAIPIAISRLHFSLQFVVLIRRHHLSSPFLITTDYHNFSSQCLVTICCCHFRWPFLAIIYFCHLWRSFIVTSIKFISCSYS